MSSHYLPAMTTTTHARIFTIVKYAIYSLLAANIYVFFRHATLHEGLDCLGWIILLAAFEWETSSTAAVFGPYKKHLLAALEVLAYSLILYALVHYCIDGAWLDVVNAVAWLMLVASIEWDVRYKPTQPPYWRRPLKIILYSSLLAIAVLWGITGDALNFYDAFLWILCFFFIELNLLRFILRSNTDLPHE